MTTETPPSIEAEVAPWGGELLPEPARLARKDIRAYAQTMGRDEARYMVDLYYQAQDLRIATASQARNIEEPTSVARWAMEQFSVTEQVITRLLDEYTSSLVVGRWAKSQYGIGPVITAGLLAHIDIERAPTAGHIWRFAGLDPTVTWRKGEKRPWNADLKAICWRMGSSFVKFAAHPKCYYGHVYRERKALEVSRNEDGVFGGVAAAEVASGRKLSEQQRAAYEGGRLPDGRVDLRARRVAVKLFLAHLQTVWYSDHYGTPPPKPYVIEHLGHGHYLAPPNWPMAEP